MPTRAPRPCPVPGCDQLITTTCPRHPPVSKLAKGYGGDWPVIARRFLAAHPSCARCGRRAVDVHHVLPRRAGGTNHPSNLRSLCRACHNHITRRAAS